ncbi:AAA family ATPase [Raoultella planticola]
MTFRILNILQDGKWLPMIHDINDLENVFTVITGRNSSGKSRLLSKAINASIFREENSHVKFSGWYSDRPERVIAISTGKFDRFPTIMHAGKNNNFIGNYSYHGVKNPGNPFNEIIKSFLLTILDKNNEETNRVRSLDYLLKYLGFGTDINVSLSLNINTGLMKERRYEDFAKDMLKRTMRKNLAVSERYQKLFNTNMWVSFVHEVRGRLNDLDLGHDAKKITVQLNYNELKFESFSKLDSIHFLLDWDILQVSEISFNGLTEKKRLGLSTFSSGQQCMLLIILGILSSIQNNSLVCIDEPEISLHPEWQLEFIKLLQDVFSLFSGCHFLIATHSPQIVSGLRDRNGYILSLEDKQLFQHDSFMKSADFQLAEIFQSPGFKNEYLIRTLLVIISKVSKNDKLNSSDLKNLALANSLREHLDERDPVMYLIKQANALVG